jgi:putative oxidoreductase
MSTVGQFGYPLSNKGDIVQTLNRDLGLLIARVALGVVFLAHGWQKVFEYGLDGVTQSFTQMGVPAPQLSAYFAAFAELGAGAFLIAGLATPIVAAILALDMAGAFFTVHAGNGIFVAENGYELVLVLGAGAAALALLGAGRFSADAAVLAAAKRRK